MAIHGVVGPQMPKNARVRALTGEPLLKRLIICNQCRCTARNGFGQERFRAREGQHDLGLHALACFLAATALNPWRFDAISTLGCFASAWIAIRYRKQSVSKQARAAASVRFASTWMLPPPILLIRLESVFAQPLQLPGFPRNWASPRPAPCSPEPRASSAPRSFGPRASSTLYPPVPVRQTRACLQAVSVRKPPSLRWHIRQASCPFGLCVRQGAHLPVRLSAAFAGHHPRESLGPSPDVVPARASWSLAFAIAQVQHFDRLRVRQTPRTYELSGRLPPHLLEPRACRFAPTDSLRRSSCPPARFPGRCSAMLARLLQDCVTMLALWDWSLLTYRQSRRTGAIQPLACVFLWLSRSAKCGASTWCVRV